MGRPRHSKSTVRSSISSASKSRAVLLEKGADVSRRVVILRLVNNFGLKSHKPSGVAREGRGDGPPRVSSIWGDTICFFYSFETKNPLIGRKTFFYGHHILLDWKLTRFIMKTFFFLVFSYILADKGWHHEIPPRVPPFLATPLHKPAKKPMLTPTMKAKR